MQGQTREKGCRSSMPQQPKISFSHPKCHTRFTSTAAVRAACSAALRSMQICYAESILTSLLLPTYFGDQSGIIIQISSFGQGDIIIFAEIVPTKISHNHHDLPILFLFIPHHRKSPIQFLQGKSVCDHLCRRNPPVSQPVQHIVPVVLRGMRERRIPCAEHRQLAAQNLPCLLYTSDAADEEVWG